MYQRILLCYDATAEGRNALKEGAEVAIAMRAETHLLAILRTGSGINVPDAYTESYFRAEDEAARDILDAGVRWLHEHGLEAHGHFVCGDPINEIPAKARELGVDLIVVGHRNRSPLARWWSDAEDAALLELCPCSILVVVVPESRDS